MRQLLGACQVFDIVLYRMTETGLIVVDFFVKNVLENLKD